MSDADGDGTATLSEGDPQLTLHAPSSTDPLQHMSTLTKSQDPAHVPVQPLLARLDFLTSCISVAAAASTIPCCIRQVTTQTGSVHTVSTA